MLAAIITPAAKPSIIRWRLGEIWLRNKKSMAAPKAVIRKVKPVPLPAQQKCLSQEKNSFPGRSGTKTPADMIEGALSQPMTADRWGFVGRAEGQKGKKFTGNP